MLSKLARQNIITQLKQETGVQLVYWNNQALVIKNPEDVELVERFMDRNHYYFLYQYETTESEYA